MKALLLEAGMAVTSPSPRNMFSWNGRCLMLKKHNCVEMLTGECVVWLEHVQIMSVHDDQAISGA